MAQVNDFKTEYPTHTTLIPKDIMRNNGLKPNEKIFYSEIIFNAQTDGFSNIDINVLSKAYNVSRATILGWISGLEKAGLIERIYQVNDYNIVEQLKNKSLLGLGIGNKQCKWCKIKTHILHNHHYPVPKKDGGDKVVAICPNCHHEFHHLKNSIGVVNLIHIKLYKETN